MIYVNLMNMIRIHCNGRWQSWKNPKISCYEVNKVNLRLTDNPYLTPCPTFITVDIYIYIYISHQVMLQAQIFQTLSCNCPYHPLLSVGFPDYILCLYRAVVNKFLLVGQHWQSKGP